MVPSRVEIQCECAFTYMNAVFRKNLTNALAVDANHVGTASDTSGALGDGRDRARFCRTTATCIWGVDSPPFVNPRRIRPAARRIGTELDHRACDDEA
jgi:hypothetical protein